MGPLSSIPLPLQPSRLGSALPGSLRRLGRSRSLQAGQVLVPEGQRPPSIWVVEAGALSLGMTTRSGTRILLDIAGPGDVVGEQALIDLDDPHAPVEDGPPLPECRALTATRVLDLSPTDVANALGRDAALSEWFATSLARRVINLHRSLARGLSLRLPDRTLDLLLALSSRTFGSPSDLSDRVGVPLTQEDLAAMLGVTRESVNRALRGLERAGAIRRVGRSYTVRRGARVQADRPGDRSGRPDRTEPRAPPAPA